MSRKSILYRILAATTAVVLTACAEEGLIAESGQEEAVEIKGLMPIMSRAGVAVVDLKDYVGRKDFADKDQAVFVKIQRTETPLTTFTYNNVIFECKVSTSNNLTSVAWSRNKTAEGTGSKDRIYWTDASSNHTFVGYCIPQQGESAKAFDWSQGDDNAQPFYGSLGDPTVEGDIDFRSMVKPGLEAKENKTAEDSISGNVELCKNDILLTYSTTVKAEDAIAKLLFHHGLAQVRVIVNISGFAEGGGKDTESIVSNMLLKQMLTMYKWDKLGITTSELSEAVDQGMLNTIYGDNVVKWDQRKDIKLWIPDHLGIGGNQSSKTFTFYGLAVPTVIPTEESGKLHFSFDVTYPDPMKHDATKTQTYKASIGGIHFDAGKCTTINISLNHRNEKMTVGAEYDEWDFQDTPDQGELKKKSTYLASGDLSKVTWHGEPGANADDATWLYTDGGKVVDLYGNDGTTEGTAYTITTADELLSFAKEVTNGYDFTNQFVRLDANIQLQKTIAGTDVLWPGIGTSTNAFNGTFLGGNRSVKLLSGKPFFTSIGPKGRVDALLLEDVLDVTEGGGAFAALNQGVICASTVTSKASESFNVVGKSETIVYNNATKGSTVAGSMVGRNEGVVFACHSNGKFSTNAARVGGLVGYNTGALVVSYTSIKATTTSTAPEKIYRGIVGYNDYAPSPLPSGKAANEYGSITYCFFDRDIANNVQLGDITAQVYGKTTVQMKKSDFIGVTDRYALMSDADKTLLSSLAAKDYNILVQGSSNEKLTTDEEALRDRLLSTLNGTITYIAYHSYLCPKIINDAYNDGGSGTSDQLQFLIDHFLSHYYLFKVGDYPQVY